jgi:hypothetical protein
MFNLLSSALIRPELVGFKCELVVVIISVREVLKLDLTIKVSEELYWCLVRKKMDGKYRSVDAMLRQEFGLPDNIRPHLKCKEKKD